MPATDDYPGPQAERYARPPPEPGRAAPRSASLTAVSIYGPPPRPPARVSQNALVALVRLLVIIVAVSGLTCVGVFALLDFQDASRKSLEIDRVQRSVEVPRLETADLMPAIPVPPKFEIPEPLQSAEILAPARTRPAVEPASPVETPPPLQSAELLPPAPAHPEPLQSAEILR